MATNKRVVAALVSAGILASLVCVVVMDSSVIAPGSHVEYKAREKWGVRGRMDPRAVALLQSSPRLRAVFEHAKHNRGARVALKQQLTILCDEGRSHPEYWSLKSELDSLDGGEDDSDVLDEDGSFNRMSFGDSMNLDDKLSSMSAGVGTQLSDSLSFKDTGMGDSFADTDSIQDY